MISITGELIALVIALNFATTLYLTHAINSHITLVNHTVT
jgi:hypothetical protein